MSVTSEVIPDSSIPVLDHGFVRLDAAMADDLSVVNAARVSFARRREEVDDADAGLIRFLMRDRHGCYDDATEVLTGEGWKRWPDVTGEESFATRSVDGRLEYQPALRLVRKDYRGHMIGFKGMSLDLLVTPDHRVLTAGMTTLEGRTCPVFASNQRTQCSGGHTVTLRRPRGAARSVEEFRFDLTTFPAGPLLRLLGFFIGDGNRSRRTTLSSISGRNARSRSSLAPPEAGLEVRVWKNQQPSRPHRGRASRPLRLLLRRKSEKVIPSGLLGWRRALVHLYEGLLESDGSRLDRPGRAERQTYYTTSRTLADGVQVLALKLGRSATVPPHRFSPGDGHMGSKPRWRVTIYNARNARPALCRTKEQADSHMGVEEYDGQIHCVEVPNSTLYVRRNGYAVWCGNTPFEHNSFRFHIRCPIFVAREWFRHRIWLLQ